jgi:hypothetical protein
MKVFITEDHSGEYYNSYFDAARAARDYAESQGYRISERDWENEVYAPGARFMKNRTYKHEIRLEKGGKLVAYLIFDVIVYNTDKYELVKTIEKYDDSKSYYNSYTKAINAALDYAHSEGYEIDPEELAQEIGYGPGRPKGGKTVRHHITLYKKGKKQNEALTIVVTDREIDGNTYELVKYIS